MTEQKINQILNNRVKELLTITEVMNTYQSFETKEKATEYIFNQALITLMYSHEERIEMAKIK